MTNPLTVAEIEELERIEGVMTPGEWKCRSSQRPVVGDMRLVCEMSPRWHQDNVSILVSAADADKSGHGRQHRDAAGIVALRNAAKELIRLAKIGLAQESWDLADELASLRRIKAEAEKLVAVMDEMDDDELLEHADLAALRAALESKGERP